MRLMKLQALWEGDFLRATPETFAPRRFVDRTEIDRPYEYEKYRRGWISLGSRISKIKMLEVRDHILDGVGTATSKSPSWS